MTATTPRKRDETGASLIMVLVAIAILSLLVPALLTLTGTGLLITRPVLDDRVEVYAATSALNAAIAKGRMDGDIGTPGAPCPDEVLSVNGLDVTLGCANPPPPEDGCHTLDRFVVFTAEVRKPGDTEVLAKVTNEVVYRFRPGGGPRVEVRQFSNDPAAPVTTVPIPSCRDDVPPPTTTTTTTTVPPSTSTTSTTTTTVPPTTTTSTVPTNPIMVVADFTCAGVIGNDGRCKGVRVKPTSSSNWKAMARSTVVDQDGSPVEGAQVHVHVEHLWTTKVTIPPDWTDEGSLVATTEPDGTATFETGSLKNTGTKRIQGVRFTITEVTRAGHDWTGEDAGLLVIEIDPAT